MVSQFDYLAGCRYKFGNLGLRNDQRRSDFQHHEVVSADLGKDATIPKQTHDQNLSEHGGMNLGERFKWDAQCQALGSGEFDSA